MKAWIIFNPGDIRMVEVDTPKVGPEDVLIKVIYSGICGTDIGIFKGEVKGTENNRIIYPIRFGHEWSGVVEQTGHDVKTFRPGDKVVSESGVTCGTCEACVAGEYGQCKEIKSLGTFNTWDGSFAEYMLIPERHLYKLPEQIRLDEAALIEPACIAYSAVSQSDLTSHSTVVVIGTGVIGLSAVALAKDAGAACVLLSGRTDQKLEIGKIMGADKTINACKEDVKSFVMEHTDGKGADVVIETSGNIETVKQSVQLVKSGGLITLVGFYETELNGFDIDRLVTEHIHMQGIVGQFKLVPHVMDLMASQKLNLAPLITQRYSFDEAAYAIKNADENRSEKI